MGIDYGNGKTNIDTATGIRYGVISINEVMQAWCDDSEAVYSNGCPKCGNELEEKEHTCPHCNTVLIDLDLDFQEPIGYKYDAAGYKATSGDSGDIFVILSPFYTLCEFCSPCAPSAGYLTDAGDVKAYCFGPEWFEDEKTPYDVYNVATGEKVHTATTE